MQDLDCIHGFMSNYKQTVFLRQVQDSQNVWNIQYSPVIKSSASYNDVLMEVSLQEKVGRNRNTYWVDVPVR